MNLGHTPETNMPSEATADDEALMAPDTPLPFVELFFPLGFPLRIETNHPEVLAVARRSWGESTQRYSDDPLLIAIEIADGHQEPRKYQPECQVIEGVLTIAFDEGNDVVVDLEHGVARGRLHRSLIGTKASLQYYVLEAAALSMISTLRAVALHAACVDWNGSGILLCGESGAGKTSLAYACARAGWSYLSDDASYLLLKGSGRIVTGNCQQIRFRSVASRLFPELEGREITPRVAGKPSIELATSELDNIRCIESTNIENIVFINRDPSYAPGLYLMAKELALDYFTKFLLRPADNNSHVRSVLDRLANARIFELRFTQFDSAIDRMRELVEGKR